MKSVILILLFSVFLISESTSARSKRVAQIPNGSVNGCANCHVSPAGGGARNAFGQLVEAQFLDRSGDVVWSSAIAMLDADGDGFTNGEELQDSLGIWTGGAIGDPNSVYLPGDANSHPPLTSVRNELAAINTYKLEQNYPNPFNPTTVINFQLPQSNYVELNVYNLNGELVENLISGELQSGSHQAVFNGSGLASGIYIYQIRTNNFVQTKRMVLMK